ncbi:exodeoxyribonuclease III [Leptospirillum ferriphilum]|nr:exodeoxyribonuclease III [Leptospirillum ferriphilum]EDZ39275.1 MAG: Exodeoxyribonuclease III [Leptospirillum sp. Group II '5-way CG']KGA92982.1 Exodeoxyribonuclease III [Leptospirillum ferriphilum]
MEPEKGARPLFKTTTWNVNSLKVRLPQVLDWLVREKADVVCLQETKLPDAQFPFQAFREIGYDAVWSGQPTYNGVAILSNTPIELTEASMDDHPDDHRRFLSARIRGVRIVNVYVPNGQDLDSPKFTYKLEWLNRLTRYIEKVREAREPVLLMGDFNIVPGDLDTWDPEGFKDQIFHSPPERKALGNIFQAGFSDLYRTLYPDRQEFSWWDYRMGSFHRNRGLRIDLILSTPPLSEQCREVFIDREARKAERPSDHVPVTALFSL